MTDDTPIDTIVDIVANLETWNRKLIQIHGSYYISIPKMLVRGANKGKGSTVKLRRGIDKTGRLILLLEI